MKEIKWRLTYDELWLKFRNNEFRFEDALEIIFSKNKFTEKEIKSGSKLLNIIEDNGCAFHKKVEYDRRIRVYVLLNPESVSNAKAIYQKASKRGKFNVVDLVGEANKSARWEYLFIKDSAISFYTADYRSLDVHHLSILEEETDSWIALLKIANFPLILEGNIINEAKKAKTMRTVFLHTDLHIRKNQIGKEHYQLPEYTILESLRDNDLESALSILIVWKDRLNWKMLMDLTKSSGFINALGFSFECINYVAKRQVFNKNLIAEIKPGKETEIMKESLEATMNPEYDKLEEKWNVKCRQANVFKKIVEDLIK